MVLEAYNKRQEDEQKLKLLNIYELADVIANRVASIIDDKNKRITVEEAHPDLFGESTEDMKMAMARKQADTRHAFANKWNDILRKKNGRLTRINNSD